MLKSILIRRHSFLMVFFMLVVGVQAAAAQTTEFTYEGFLNDNGQPANASYDFEFRLYDAASGGSQQGATLQRPNVAVANGVFKVMLDFGAAIFTGENRFLEIASRLAGTSDPFTVILPRPQLLSVPYAIRSLNATTADNATNATNAMNATNASNATTAQNAIQLGGVTASQYVLTTDPRLTDARSPLPNSANYVQNSTVQQAASNFNISGDGAAGGTLSANAMNAQTQYSIGGNRILSNPGTANLFAGVGAGSFTTGINNSFFGRNAGNDNTTGNGNSFFGNSAGASNTTSSANAFFGNAAGSANTTGGSNAFFGNVAGSSNTSGNHNAFFGYQAGADTTTSNNSFFGSRAGSNTTTGYRNSFFGALAARLNSTGYDNAFFGYGAGHDNTTGSNNAFFGTSAGQNNKISNQCTAIGNSADVANGISFGTAIGAGSFVGTPNTLALGRTKGLDKVVIYGLGAAGSTPICRNASNQLSTCSSSLRYKTTVASFVGGLDMVRRLRPITFNWKDGGRRDLGFAAEAVEQIDPLLVTHNDQGEVEGVKYGQLTTVLVNAINEQQAQIRERERQAALQQQQIDQYRKQLTMQQQEMAALKQLLCRSHPRAAICQPTQRKP